MTGDVVRGRRSLRTRLVAMVTLLLASIAVALLVFLPERIESRSRALVEARAVGITNLLASAMGPALEFDDESSARDRLGQLASTPDAIYAEVVRADGSELASWSTRGTTPPKVAGTTPGIAIDDSVLHVVVRIASKGGTQGFLAVGFTLEELDRERAAALRLVAITSIIVLVVGFVFAFSIGTLLIRPIERMTQLALKISTGDSTRPSSVDLDRRDEVGTMARAFALMLDAQNRHRSFLECQGEASADGILIVSEQRQVLSFNKRFVKLWGFPDDEMPTRDSSALLAIVAERTVDPAGLVRRITQLRQQPFEVATDEIRCCDGRIFECHTAPITSSDGTYFGRGWYFRDVTDRCRAEDQIRALNADLEQRVEERTRALEGANDQLATRLQQLGETQQKLVEASRKSGMADVATAVLHNVGNVLNSINVSASVMLDAHRASKAHGLKKAIEMLVAHQSDLAGFVESPRGKLVVSYLSAVVDALDTERKAMEDELTSLQNNVDHINVIVSRQQDNAKHAGVVETVAIESLVEDALTLNKSSHERHGVAIVRDYHARPVLACDRHKLFQILMNFLSNANQAVAGNPTDARRITVRTRMADERSVIVEVEDNGVGIPEADLSQIFTLGFTTKSTGHGFGLHSSACHAVELGGRVAVESDGAGKGARFRVVVPLKAPSGAFDR